MLKRSILIAAIMIVAATSTVSAIDRAEELKKEMWETTDKDFHATDVPEKWLKKSAVIIAKLHRYAHR